LTLARRLLQSAIMLDLQQPVMDGLRVLEHLKAHPQTRHIPVHVLSGLDRKLEGLSRGAAAYVDKPVSKERLHETFVQIERLLQLKASKLLVVEDDERERNSLKERVFKLFESSLASLGILCLGRRESLRFTSAENDYEEFDARERIYRRTR